MKTIWILFEQGEVQGNPYTHFYNAFTKYQDAKDALGTQFHDDLLEFDSKELKVKVEFEENAAVIYETECVDQWGNCNTYHIYRITEIPIYNE